MQTFLPVADFTESARLLDNPRLGKQRVECLQVLRALTGSAAWVWISPEDTFDVLANALFRVPGSAGLLLPAALLAVAVMAAGSVWILERRVRAVDIVT